MVHVLVESQSGCVERVRVYDTVTKAEHIREKLLIIHYGSLLAYDEYADQAMADYDVEHFANIEVW
jgi:hypothetical protein